MTVAEELIEHISQISKIPENELSGDTEIYNSGIISSLTLLEIMTFLEKKYKIIMNSDELIEDNFKDINRIAHFIVKKTSILIEN